MRAPVVLAVTQHDPDDAMLPQALRVLPQLHQLYAGVVMLATPTTGRRTIEVLREQAVRVEREQNQSGVATVGLVRQQVIRLAAEQATGHVHLCD